jgi:hypothetical protein
MNHWTERIYLLNLYRIRKERTRSEQKWTVPALPTLQAGGRQRIIPFTRRKKNMKPRIFFLCLSLCSGLSFTARADLIAYYQFQNPNDLGLDSSGNGNNLVVNGSVGSTSDGVNGGGGLVLTGQGDLSTVSGLAPSDFPQGNSDYTISVWFNTTDQNVGGTVGGGLIGWGDYGVGGGSDTNALRLDYNGSSYGFDNYWWGNDLLGYPSDQSNLFGAWNNITATYDGTTRTLYYDGVYLTSDTPGLDSASDANFFIGLTNPGNPEYFTGTLSDVAVFNTALTQSEVDDFIFAPEPGTVWTVWIALGALLLLGCRRRAQHRSA